jgi:hypothetical protein
MYFKDLSIHTEGQTAGSDFIFYYVISIMISGKPPSGFYNLQCNYKRFCNIMTSL